MKINCIQLIAGLNINSGGPSRSVSKLCDALSSSYVNVSLLTQKLNNENLDDIVLPRNSSIPVVSIPAFKFLRTRFSFSLTREIDNYLELNNINILHSHGLWLQCNRVAAEISNRHHLVHIISPRGMLEPWAFKYRYWKKAPFWFLWQRRALMKSTVFCATSMKEAEGIRMLGFKQPIAVIPNGVDLPNLSINTSFNHKQVKTALFISRIHPVKGLLNLVHAWDRIRPTGWRCVIAGPDEEGYESIIKQEVANLGLQHVFEFIGPVYDDRKSVLFQTSDLFVLPTQSENFGLVIAEALAYEIPVITTKGAPWACILDHNCGWWIEHGVQPLESALRQACAQSDKTLKEMGCRGRLLVEKDFSWKGVGSSMKSVYEWSLNGGAKPDCVRLD